MHLRSHLVLAVVAVLLAGTVPASAGKIATISPYRRAPKGARLTPKFVRPSKGLKTFVDKRGKPFGVKYKAIDFSDHRTGKAVLAERHEGPYEQRMVLVRLDGFPSSGYRAITRLVTSGALVGKSSDRHGKPVEVILDPNSGEPLTAGYPQIWELADGTLVGGTGNADATLLIPRLGVAKAYSFIKLEPDGTLRAWRADSRGSDILNPKNGKLIRHERD